MSSLGYYVRIYVFYLLIAIVAVAGLLGLNLFLKIVPRETLRSPVLQMIGLIAVLALPLALVVAGSINYNFIRVSAHHIKVPRKSSALDHLKIAMASDFHLREQTRKSFMSAFVAKIKALDPDIVLLPGDILEDDRSIEGTAEFAKAFRKIDTKYGVYASMGNHDSRGRSDKLSFFEEAGIRVLIDNVVRIDDAFYLVGRNPRRQRKPLSDLLEDTKTDLPILLMDHRPSELFEVARSPVDIQFSGHTHNGQLFPGNIVRKLQYGLSWGHKRIGTADFFVTCGIQGWGPLVRTAGYSEIMLVDVDFVK